MTLDEQFDSLTSMESAQFQKICRKLLKTTFIVREKNDEQKKDFYFARSHQDLFRGYLHFIGYDIAIEEGSGIIMLVNMASANEESEIQSGRKRLRLQESIVLCCLWLLFADKMVIGSLTRAITIEKSELDFQLEKFGYKNGIDKNTMTNILSLFSSYNLIEVIGKIGEPDCRIKLYPSLQFCLSETEFQRQAALTAQKLQERQPGNVAEDTEEEDDE